jgi:Cu/Ag efflux protein CusF
MIGKIAAALLAAVLLVGCGEAAPEAPPSDAAEAAVEMATGTGTVTALDAEAGTITLAHEAMPEVGWPAMTMAFKADPALLAAVKEGDEVAFDLTLAGGSGEITALRAK